MSMKILILDDEAPILRTLESFLRLRGYAPQTETNPVAALEHLAREPFHLVLTDLVMPEMDGLEFVRRVRAADPMIQVIVMTAYSSMDRTIEAFQLGASDYLLKPFESLDEVGRMVDYARSRVERWREALRRTIEINHAGGAAEGAP